MTKVVRHLSLAGLVAGLLWMSFGSRQISATPDKVVGVASGASAMVESLPLDAFTDGLVAYALRRLRSDYTGPALIVRRGSDNAEQGFGFNSDGALDNAALESWLAGSDGYVVRWYSQVPGEPDLVQTDTERQPLIAESGITTSDSDGHAAIRFEADRNTFLDPETQLSTAYTLHNMLAIAVGEVTSGSAQHVVNFQNPGEWSHYALSIRVSDGSFQVRGSLIESTQYNAFERRPSAWIINSNADGLHTFNNNYNTGHKSLESEISRTSFRLGASTKSGDKGFDGYIAAFVLHPGQSSTELVQDRYDAYNALLELGPTGYSQDAILPQKQQWQVVLYNWMETLSVEDVRLPALQMKWDGGPQDVDDLADVWLQLEGASASRVVRGEPEWYVLDAGNGKGIEATGEVRVWHEPESGHGNPPRSWSNEPAFLYQLSVPNGDGSEGNPYYQFRPLGLRALVVAAVDMMMYSEESGACAQWTDMHGKALLGWAEAYRWTKSEISADVKNAFETGFAYFLGRVLRNGARGVNTNMDMFAVQAAAEIYMATDDPELKEKSLGAVKRILYGYPDGEMGVRHDTWANRADDPRGVFSPSGYIMEGGQADVFYQGESFYHLTGALSALSDRETGKMPSEWTFLGDVVERMETWFVYQGFSDPGRTNSKGSSTSKYYHGGAGYAGRTGAAFPAGQAAFRWRDLTLADYFDVARHRLFSASSGHVSNSEAVILPLPWQMKDAVASRLSSLTSALSSPFAGAPNVWKGWSPWTKPTPYLPPKGWYSRLNDLIDESDPSVLLPIDREGHYYSKAFGGPPTGHEFWVYKNSDGARDFGWFVEAQATQGPYGGWYGGKIETFWTSTTGVVLLNRHGKGGCGDKFEDSTCWDNLEYRAAHHVWGRDENGKAFTPLHITDEDAHVRTSTFDMNASTPSVEVVNHFNAPDDEAEGEQNAGVLDGAVSIANRFEVRGSGIRVSHTLTSDKSDEVTELWTSLPIFLRSHRPGDWGHQSGLHDTSIEFQDGESWRAMPEDANGDGIPEFVQTKALRLGRNFQLGDGIQYAYVAFDGAQRVRLASQTYSDPYQTRTLVRTVHIDMHGNPGTVRKLPGSRTLQYTIQTTEPVLINDGELLDQQLSLRPGWNLVGRYVEPAEPSMDRLLEDLHSCVAVVKDGAGRAYAPGLGIDAIGYWAAGEGYKVYASESCAFSIEGRAITRATVHLRSGWNLIGYPHGDPQPVDEALSSLGDAIVRLEDGAGNVYDPSEGFDTIGDLQPGHGYRILVRGDASLTFRAPQ